jgi:alkaline phosphatase
MIIRSILSVTAVTITIFLVVIGSTTCATALNQNLHQSLAIILYIGDGMGEAHRTAGQWASVGQGGQLNMDTLSSSGWAMTNDASGIVTDSAAAATAMATGEKTWNGRISMGIDLEPLQTILEQAQERGWSVGLVTTVQMAHATPAAFAAHIMSRNSMSEIALQMVEHQVNVLLAGGEDDFLPNTETGCYPGTGHRKDDRNLIREALADGYTYVCNADQLSSVDFESTKTLLGLFADDGMERPYSPTLKQMTVAAISILSRDPDGFFLMVEGGQIDWASHAQEAENVIDDVLGFDAAIASGLEYALEHENTLIIVTADHETGGMSIDLESSGKFNEDGPFYTPDNIPFYVNWTSTEHTDINVPTTAQGEFSDQLSGIYENTNIYDVMRQFMGWEGFLPTVMK